jgi:peptide/nickel transport system substrate-binding protein
MILVACAPPPSPRSGEAPGQSARPATSRTLAMAMRVEPATVASKGLRPTQVRLDLTRRLFNATVALADERVVYRPYLVEALPKLNTDAWRVFPDGRMETTYRLRPGLVWHDGTELTSADFAFSWRVYSTPDLGQATSTPQGLIEEILTPDARTFVIRWQRPFADAAILAQEETRGLPPLPRHLLQAAYDRADWDAFLALPYWTTEYVHLGPYRLDHWEPGVSIDASAFDQHILGRPKIDRIRIAFINDSNTALANLVSGAIDLAADDAVGFLQGITLKRDWAERNAGSVLVSPNLFRGIRTQMRPELLETHALLDVRVRKALAHGLDRQTINDRLFDGQNIMAESAFPPMLDFYPVIDRALVKYPYDLRRSEQLMSDLGFTRGGDGIYASRAEGRLAPELKTNASAQYEAEMGAIAAGWRQAGFDMRETVLPTAQAQDPQTRASFPGLFIHSGPQGESMLEGETSSSIPKPENRWNGRNRGAWSNAEYDRLFDSFSTTLDRTERVRLMAELERVFTDDLPFIPLHFDPGVTAHTAALRGPAIAPDRDSTGWNVHEWELR